MPGRRRTVKNPKIIAPKFGPMCESEEKEKMPSINSILPSKKETMSLFFSPNNKKISKSSLNHDSRQASGNRRRCGRMSPTKVQHGCQRRIGRTTFGIGVVGAGETGGSRAGRREGPTRPQGLQFLRAGHHKSQIDGTRLQRPVEQMNKKRRKKTKTD